MSIFNVTNYDVESFSLETNPKSYFASSSSGIVGAQYVFSRKSSSIKNELEPNIDSNFNDSNNEELTIFKQNGTKKSEKIKNYFDKINKLQSKNPYRLINRLIPIYDDPPDNSDSVYNSDDLKKEVNEMKSIISGTLFPYYRNVMTNPEFSYTNYSCLNFVSSSETSADAALIYPNVNDSLKITDQFTINFHINVRNKYSTTDFRPGTILHLSSVYAISVISGTQRDESDKIKTYGIQLQLKHSADISPSQASFGTYPSDLIWKFDDVLKHNSWHDVTLTWAGLKSSGEKIYNDATGSLYVDGILGGNFIVPSSSLTSNYALRNKPHLVIGNYYEGVGNMSDFFNQTIASAYGLKYISGTGTTEKDYPFSYPTKFNHVGFFELHDINIKNTVSSGSLVELKSTPKTFDEYQFYLSPFFNEVSNLRKVIDKNAAIKKGGVMITPRHTVTGSTSTPFNVAMSFGVGAHIMNLENHLSESKYARTPFILNMSAFAAATLGSYSSLSVNDYFYTKPELSASVRTNNLFIMPCDDGNFQPNTITNSVNLTNYHITNKDATAGLTISENLGRELWDSNPNTEIIESLKFNEDNLRQRLSEGPGGPTPAAYSLNPTFNDTTKAIPAWIHYSETKSDNVSGTDKRFPGAAAYKFFDRDSRQIVIFDISNLYYGNSILPESFMLTDTALTGSGGRTSITIKDDGRGGLYRADSLTTHAKFNNIGNIFYKEGIVLIKNPSLYFVGKDSYEISFKGNRNVHVMKVETIAPRGSVNKSVNTTFINDLKPSPDQIDDDDKFVYISGINYHDDNLNVVARVKLAQPILKREYSKIAFRMKLDF